MFSWRRFETYSCVIYNAIKQHRYFDQYNLCRDYFCMNYKQMSNPRYVSKKAKEHAWSKAAIVPGKNPNLYRMDKYGSEIYKPSYGKNSPKGYEIDHSKPVSKGGTNHKNNLQVLQTSNNRAKGNKY